MLGRKLREWYEFILRGHYFPWEEVERLREKVVELVDMIGNRMGMFWRVRVGFIQGRLEVWVRERCGIWLLEDIGELRGLLARVCEEGLSEEEVQFLREVREDCGEVCRRVKQVTDHILSLVKSNDRGAC